MYLRDIIHKLNAELSRCQRNNVADNNTRKDESRVDGVGKTLKLGFSFITLIKIMKLNTSKTKIKGCF